VWLSEEYESQEYLPVEAGSSTDRRARASCKLFFHSSSPCPSESANWTCSFALTPVILLTSQIRGRAVKNEHIVLGVLGSVFGGVFLATRGGKKEEVGSPASMIEKAKQSIPINASSKYVSMSLVYWHMLTRNVSFFNYALTLSGNREEEQLYVLNIQFPAWNSDS